MGIFGRGTDVALGPAFKPSGDGFLVLGAARHPADLLETLQDVLDKRVHHRSSRDVGCGRMPAGPPAALTFQDGLS